MQFAEVVRVTATSDTATWVVAGATVALFIVTGLLFWATKRMVDTTAREVRIETSRIEAAQRPHVYPVTLDPWATDSVPYNDGRARRVLPIANAGPGIAHNVTGLLRFADGTYLPVVPLTIQPAQTLDARLDWGAHVREELGEWRNAHGFLVYDDVAGQAWITEYYIRESNNRLSFEFQRSARLEDFGNVSEHFQLVAVALYGERYAKLEQILSAPSAPPLAG